jgi:hypothetical protein
MKSLEFEQSHVPPGNLNPVPRVRLNAFDYLVLAGAGVNLLVFGWLIGFWLFAG